MNINTYIPFDNLLDLMLDAVCIVDEQDRIVFVSPACERVFGYQPEEMVGMNIFDLVHPDDRDRTFDESRSVMSGNLQTLFENRYIHKDGSTVYIMWSARWSDDHKLRIGVARDITERKKDEIMQEAVYAISEAAHTSQDLPALFQEIHQIIGRLMPVNNFFVGLYDEKNDTLRFPYFVDEKHEAPATGKLDFSSRIAEVIRNGKPVLYTRKDEAPPNLVQIGTGHDALSWLGVPLKSDQNVIGILAVQSYSGNTHYSESDLDLLQFVSTQIAAAIARKTMLDRLEFMAQRDSLTGLPNRELFMDRLHIALARAKREQQMVSLLFIDLDKFKAVNDTMGHTVGDLLLQQIASRLTDKVRASDSVSRFGGDEFIVLLEGIKDLECAEHCAEKIRTIFDEPFVIEGQSVEMSPSIGMVIYPVDGEDEQQLLKHADQAMYDAKKLGGNRIRMKSANA